METKKLDTVRLKDGSEYPISGSWNDLTDKPLQTVQTALFSDAALNFAYVSNYGSYIYETQDSSLLQKWYAAWKNAIVTIDGVQYMPEKQTAGGESFLGDAFRLQTGSSVTGEPYAIGVTNGWFVIALFADSAPEDISAKETHTVSLTLENDVIQSDYLPAVPEFDLTAMGLPCIPIGGDRVSVSCDTTDLRTALDKGLVKLSFKAGDGSLTSSASYIATAINMEGQYQISFVGMLVAPMLFSIAITSSAISAQIITLAVPAASADTASTDETT